MEIPSWPRTTTGIVRDSKGINRILAYDSEDHLRWHRLFPGERMQIISGIIEKEEAGDLSTLSGVLDMYGGLRTVITYQGGIWAHVGAGEIECTVPGFWIREPLHWELIPWATLQVRRYLAERWRLTRNQPLANDHPLNLFEIRTRSPTTMRTPDVNELVWG
jgi:hypothetical protein